MNDLGAIGDRGPSGRGATRGGGRSGGGSSGQGQGKGAKGRGGGKGQGQRTGQGGKGQAKGQGGRGKPSGGRRDTAEDPAAQLKRPLEQVLARLPETQRKVLELRMGLADGHPHDLADTARALGLSLSEAREIEKRAFEHIREAVPLQQLQRFLDR